MNQTYLRVDRIVENKFDDRIAFPASPCYFDKCQRLKKETQKRYGPSVFQASSSFQELGGSAVSRLRRLSIVNSEQIGRWLPPSFLLKWRDCVCCWLHCNRRANWRLSLISTLLNSDHRWPVGFPRAICRICRCHRCCQGEEITKDTDRQSDNLQRPLEKALGRNRGAFLNVGKHIFPWV